MSSNGLYPTGAKPHLEVAGGALWVGVVFPTRRMGVATLVGVKMGGGAFVGGEFVACGLSVYLGWL